MHVFFLQGIVSGLILAMTIGPVFFALIRISINKGFKAGAFLAGGIATSDAFIASVVYSGISQFVNSPSFQSGAGLVGGIAMLIFGGKHFVQPTHEQEAASAFEEAEQIPSNNYTRLFWQGVLLNMLNPFVYLFWLGLISNLSSIIGSNATQLQGFVFLSGIVITVFCTDLLKTYIANLLSNVMTDKVISLIDRVGGAILIIFGVYLLLYAFFGDVVTRFFPNSHNHLPL